MNKKFGVNGFIVAHKMCFLQLLERQISGKRYFLTNLLRTWFMKAPLAIL